MNCPKCGTKLEDGITICPQCNTKVKEKKKRNLIGIVACIVALIAIFLPYTTVSVLGFKNSASFMQTDYGFILLIVELIVLILYILNFKIVTIVMAVIHLIIVLAAYALLSTFNVGTMGLGMYLLVLSSAVMIFSPQIWKLINNSKLLHKK